ncbi:MAG: tetratricopeptide repeat protein, partial [Verrucomicrobia bacterium]|nr:tetratricopeptide repeat protein [Verrucomicrobiota bacterium]
MKTEEPGSPGKKRSSFVLSPISAVIAFIFLCLAGARSEQANAPVMEPEVRQAFEKGLAKFQAGQFQDAKDAFARVTGLLPNYSLGWINLGSAEYRLDQLDDAEKHMRKAVHLDPDVAQAWLTLGIIAFRKDE